VDAVNDFVSLGAQFAWNEVSLALFTALSPSGVFAAIIVVCWAMSGALSEKQKRNIERKLFIPLVVSMVGLIASASHLGTPSNALYALAGVGRSPLSNEVVSGVVFLGLLGPFWYFTFNDAPRERLKRIWRILIVITGFVFVLFISLAYSVDSIPSWNLPLVPVAIWLNALVGGPLLALLTIGVAGGIRPELKCRATLLPMVSAVATVCNVGVYALYGAQLQDVGNFTIMASDLVPFFWQAVCLFALLAAMGVFLSWAYLLRLQGKASPRAVVLPVAGCVLSLSGIFFMRFVFYMLHLTYGLGL
jgi:anaerobic dimethyl sulfoxide reductase subunit C (anchor subunit)